MELVELDYKEFDEYLQQTFIVEDIFVDKKHYKTILHRLYNYMKLGFEKKEVRTHPLNFKFKDDKSEQIKTMQVRHFIINLIVWSAFMYYDRLDALNSSQIFDCTKLTNRYLTDYINDHLIAPFRTHISSKKMNRTLDKIIYRLSMIYKDFALIMGSTMDAESFDELQNKYPRFRELLNTKPTPGMQPKEIEDLCNDRMNEMVNIIINDKENALRAFLITGVGINKQQFGQLAVMGGLKPDIEGNVVPIPIDSNFINEGLNSVKNFYIDGQAGSKPLILNKTIMGKSGYFSYKMMTLSSAYRLSQDVDDCHSARPVRYVVASASHLDKIDERYYVDDKGKLHLIDASRDKHLIGQTILLRDPTTCCSPDGKICHICYGDTYYINNNPMFHAGRYAATKLDEPIEQKILSSKHLLKTTSNMLKFNDDFYRFFALDGSRIKLNMNSDEDFDKWKIVVDDEDLFSMDELSSDEDFNDYTEKFYMVNKKGDTVPIYEESKTDIYFFANVAKSMKNINGQYVFHLKDLGSEDEPIAIINIENNELSATLKNIIKLLDRKNHFGCETIDEMVNKIVSLTIESGMDIAAVHCSMLLKGLIRRTEDPTLQPDFSDPNQADDYQLLTLSNALIYHPSLAVSLSYDNVKKQITTPGTYDKYKPSDYDLFYQEDIYEAGKKYKKFRKKLKKYRKIAN